MGASSGRAGPAPGTHSPRLLPRAREHGSATSMPQPAGADGYGPRARGLAGAASSAQTTAATAGPMSAPDCLPFLSTPLTLTAVTLSESGSLPIWAFIKAGTRGLIGPTSQVP